MAVISLANPHEVVRKVTEHIFFVHFTLPEISSIMKGLISNTEITLPCNSYHSELSYNPFRRSLVLLVTSPGQQHSQNIND